jgi:RDD family
MAELDPFDDFEFKPLTDGLGFHKKAEKIKADVKSTKLDDSSRVPSAPSTNLSRFMDAPTSSNSMSPSSSSPAARSSTSLSGEIARPASQSISELIASLPPSLDFVDTPTSVSQSVSQSTSQPASRGPSRPQIFQPLARPENKPEFKSPLTMPSPTLSSSPLSASGATGPTIGSVLPPQTAAPGASAYRDKMNESFAKAFPQSESRTRTPGTSAPMTDAEKAVQKATQKAAQKELAKQTATHNMPGAILDGMVTLGISTIFLVCILAITRVNLMGLLTNANTDTSTQVHLAMLFVAVLQMYMLTARSFFGASLGEWAFDLQVGTEDQQRSAVYPLQVAWRTLLMTFTGFILLPLLSLVFKRDLAQPLTGLALVRRP